MTQLQTSGVKEFPLVIKGDVQGSIEAISGALDKLGTDEVRARIVHSGAGGITESDVSLAEASNAAIIGFNVRANKQARDASERAGIEIRYYNIIYDLVDDVKAAMSGLLSPERRETFLGNAEILEVFNITKVGKVAGCRVTEGKVERGVASVWYATTSSSTKASSRRSSASRTKSPRSSPARNAVWPSRTTRTSVPAIRSSASASNTSRGRSDPIRQGIGERRIGSGARFFLSEKARDAARLSHVGTDRVSMGLDTVRSARSRVKRWPNPHPPLRHSACCASANRCAQRSRSAAAR